MAEIQANSNLDINGSSLGRYNKIKDEIRLPSALKRRVTLSDIIAATIGEEARSCDLLCSDTESSFYTETGGNGIGADSYSSTNQSYKHTEHLQSWNPSTENSNNACDLTENHFQTKEKASLGSKTFQDFSFSVSKTTDFQEEPNVNNFTPTFGFGTEMDFLSSLFNSEGSDNKMHNSVQQSPGTSQNTKMTNKNEEYSQNTANNSYDSDLEDSMHFVDPDEGSLQEEPDNNLEPVEPVSKKQRVRLYDSSSCPFPIMSENCSGENQDFLSIFNEDIQPPQNLTAKSIFRTHGVTRARSFSGNIKPKLSRQSGKFNLLNKNSGKLPNFGRTRSFSEACNRDEFNPLGESHLHTSLSSLLESPESSPLASNPFFNDLKSLLITDCQSMDCPKTLLETLSSKPKQDVYARERNLQSKFSSLQAKYSDEVRELSSFYRQQSAEVETERLKEIHDENMPVSYRNHLNSFYDNQLHMIMERVEKSLSLLSFANREIITINRPFKSRPLLSRKAVKMMEEWYSRNFEHPYPGPTAVEALAKAGEITPEQVKKWFANKRNRCKNTKPVPDIANMKRKRQFSARW